MRRVPYEEALGTALRALRRAGFAPDKAQTLAEVFVTNTLEGVASHGLNRLPRFLREASGGVVDVNAQPQTVGALGGLEVWDGHFAAGPLIAEAAMARAAALSQTHGVACVAVRNSNHWQRAGRYGWQAVRQGVIGLLWTNTCQNLPAFGAADSQLGNDPFVLAIPRKKGPVVVDMSMSQFAYGRLEIAREQGEQLPVPGGYDAQGRLTCDPAAILESRRVLPMGYWKGAAMSLALDMIAAGLSLGRTVHMIGPAGEERGLSQVFMAIHYAGVVDEAQAQARFDDAVDALLASVPADPKRPVRYPSQNMDAIAAQNRRDGLPVSERTWQAIVALS